MRAGLSFIEVKRFEYEEPYHTEIHLTASNGDFSGSLRFYCNADDLKTLASQLEDFPRSSTDEVEFEIGSENPKWAYYLLFKVFVKDFEGHSAIRIRINLNETSTGISDFCITANPADINKLGSHFRELFEWKSREFRWAPPETV